MDLVVILLCSVALITDLSRHRVPNQLTLGGMGIGLAYWSLQLDPLFALGGIGLAFLTMFPGWIFGGGIRAGDAKLLMAVGAFYGPEMAFRSCIGTYALAIPFSLIVLLLKGKLANAYVAARATITPFPGVPEEDRVVVPFVPVVVAGILLARTTGVLQW
jgi:prepilin peptidase CpaA